ncbi:Xenotropic and polytropic retrovirus receptor 1 [Sparganum proliferum]
MSQISLPDGRINDMETLLRRRNTIRQKTVDKPTDNQLGKAPVSPTLSLHDLKLAYSEYYLSLVLLQNYQSLNYTGFRKILKKHDKLFQRSNGLQWYKEVVSEAPFYLDNTVDDLIATVETIYTQDLEKGDRQKAMKRLRVPPLANTASPNSIFRVGLFAGIFLVEVIVAAVAAFSVKPHSFSWPAFRVFRSTLLVAFYTCFLALNLFGWRSSGVNHVLIFEIDPRQHMDHFQMLEVGLLFADLWGAFVIMYIFSSHIGVPQFVPPFALVVLMLAYLFSPLPLLHYKARRWFLKIFLRILRAPFAHVNFPDFFIADQLNSLSFVFPDFAFFVCFYVSYLDWPSMQVKHSLKNVTAPVAGKSPYFAPKTTCDGVLFGICPLLRTLPAWFRFAQCLRRYQDLVFKEPMPHLYNAAKYATTFLTAVFSTWAELNPNPFTIAMVVISSIIGSTCTYSWDVIMDWGLLDCKAKDNPGLRDELVYRFRAYYYCAILEDLVIRFSWALNLGFKYAYVVEIEIVKTVVYFAEVSRRVIWNFFRLENEHLNNCGNFRAVRDIFVTPIRKSMFVAMNKDSTHSNAATLLRNGHAHKKQHNRSQYGVLDDEVGDVETLRTDDVPVESTPKAPKGYGEYATMATAATATTTVNSKSLWHFFRDLYLKNRNERRRKQGIEVISNMESALRAANAEDHVKHPTPYTPRAILRTDVSPLHEHANEDDSQADDHAELTEGRSRDDYFSDWDYEPPDRAAGGYSPPSFSAFSQDTSNHNAAAAATADVIKTDDVSCRQTLEAIVNPLPPPAVSDRRHRTVHYDQREVVLDGTPRRASVQATIPLHVCLLEPSGPVWELRAGDSETGEGSAVATGPSSTTTTAAAGASMFSSTQPGILVPHNSPTSATGSGRPSDRGWNLILDPTYLPLPDEVSDDSPDTTAIPMKTQHLARQLRSILRNFADQKKQQQLQSREDLSWQPLYRKHGEQQQQQQLENPPEESCRSVSCATRDTFLLDVDDCADAGVVGAGQQQQRDSGEPEEKREDRPLQARSSWGARPSGYQVMPSQGMIEEQQPITRRRLPSSTASKDSLFSRSEEGYLPRPPGRSPLNLEAPSATSKSEPSTSTSSVAIFASSPADGPRQTEPARSRQSSGLSPHAPPVPSRFTVATVQDTSVTPTPVIKFKKTV